MASLLYLLGTGSKWQDNEIRYSLRSACQHVPLDSVVVVGEHPEWLCNTTHVAVPDAHADPIANQLHKLLTACQDPRVPECFVLMNDDFIFLEDHAAPLKTYVRATMEQTVSAGPRFEAFHYTTLRDTMYRLWKHGIPDPLDFEGHRPLPMTKSRVRAMCDRFGGSGSTYAWRSMYGNMWPVITTHLPDAKMYRWYGPPRVPFFSLGEELERVPAFVEWMAGRFPTPCRYERC